MAIDYWPQLLGGRAAGGRGYCHLGYFRRVYVMLRKDIGGPLSRSGGGGSEGKGKMHIVLDSADEMGSLNVDDIAI